MCDLECEELTDYSRLSELFGTEVANKVQNRHTGGISGKKGGSTNLDTLATW